MSMTTTSIRLSSELKDRFEDLARATGRSKNFLMTEALERYVDAESWQVEQIKEGIRQDDAGLVVSHDDVVAGLIAKGMMTPEGLEQARQRIATE